MNWTIWRLHRSQVLFAFSALAAMAVLLLLTGTHIASVYEHALSTCAATHTCSSVDGQMVQNYRWLWTLAIPTALVPALFGLFWGAPLVAREVEEGTHKLIWTQTVPRRRWLAHNLGWVLLAAAVWGAAMTALLTWWLGTEDTILLNRFQPAHFEIQGIVPIAYSVFGVSLGIAAGAWLRRVLPAAAVTLGGYALARFVIQQFVRPHYLAPITQAVPLVGPGQQIAGRGALSGSSWVLSFGNLVNAAGHPIRFLTPSVIPAACRGQFAGSLFGCLGRHGWRNVMTYQPAGRFWTFQGIEAGIFLVLAAIVAALASWRVLTADA
jgi:hypothetical protein